MKNRKNNIKTILAAALCIAAVLSIAANKPAWTDTDSVTMTSYGTVDRSTALQGYITFTASGQERYFILRGSGNEQAFFITQEEEAIEIPLAGGAGKYQYAIADLSSDGRTCTVQYRDSFTISES